jgi:hypothetical protein
MSEYGQLSGIDLNSLCPEYETRSLYSLNRKFRQALLLIFTLYINTISEGHKDFFCASKSVSIFLFKWGSCMARILQCCVGLILSHRCTDLEITIIFILV